MGTAILAFAIGILIGVSSGAVGVCIVALIAAYKNDNEYLEHIPEKKRRDGIEREEDEV